MSDPEISCAHGDDPNTLVSPKDGDHSETSSDQKLQQSIAAENEPTELSGDLQAIQTAVDSISSRPAPTDYLSPLKGRKRRLENGSGDSQEPTPDHGERRKRRRVTFSAKGPTVGHVDADIDRSPHEMPYTCNRCGQYCLDIRYNCQKCTDFDLCLACFEQKVPKNRKHRHVPANFVRIED